MPSVQVQIALIKYTALHFTVQPLHLHVRLLNSSLRRSLILEAKKLQKLLRVVKHAYILDIGKYCILFTVPPSPSPLSSFSMVSIISLVCSVYIVYLPSSLLSSFHLITLSSFPLVSYHTLPSHLQAGKERENRPGWKKR